MEVNRLLINIVCGVAGGLIAYKKGREWYFWALLCALFPPIVLLLILLPPKLAPGKTRQCPYCAKIVYRADTQCRHCGRELPIELVQCKGCGSFVPDKDYCVQCQKKLGD